MSIFDNQSSLFKNPVVPNNTQSDQGVSILGAANTTQPKSKFNLLDSINLKTNVSQPQQSGGIFGSSQPAQSGGLLGSSQPAQNTGLFGAPQPAQTGGLLGSTAPQPQQAGGLFGGAQPANTGGLFRSTAPNQQNNSVFGQPQQQNTQQGTGLFGSLGTTNQQSQQQQPQQQAGSSLFGGLGQPAQQPQQTQQQASVLGQSLGQSRLFQGTEIAPRTPSPLCIFTHNPT